MSSQFLKCSCTKVLPGVICIIQAFQIIGAQYFTSSPLRYGINENFVQFWLKLSTQRNFVGHGFLSQWWGDNVHLLKTVSSLIFLSRLQSKWCNLKTDDCFFQMKFVGRSIFKVTLSVVSSFSILFQELLIQKWF